MNLNKRPAIINWDGRRKTEVSPSPFLSFRLRTSVFGLRSSDFGLRTSVFGLWSSLLLRAQSSELRARKVFFIKIN